LLLLNDHVLKGAGWLPGWLTGKLSSDVITERIDYTYHQVLLLTGVSVAFGPSR
jgi:hypothetical protein